MIRHSQRPPSESKCLFRVIRSFFWGELGSFGEWIGENEGAMPSVRDLGGTASANREVT